MRSIYSRSRLQLRHPQTLKRRQPTDIKLQFISVCLLPLIHIFFEVRVSYTWNGRSCRSDLVLAKIMYVGILVPFLSLFLPHRIFLYVTNTRQYKYLKVLIVLPVDEYKPPPLPFPLSSSSYSHSSINLSTMSLYQEMLNLPGYIKYTILLLLLLQGSAFAVWIYMVRGEVQNDNRLKTSKKMD